MLVYRKGGPPRGPCPGPSHILISQYPICREKKTTFALLSTPSKLPMVHRSFNNKDYNYWALTGKKKPNRTDQKTLHSHMKVSIYVSGRALLGRNKDDFQKMAARDKHAVWREC